jgi:hypothetical protein
VDHEEFIQKLSRVGLLVELCSPEAEERFYRIGKPASIKGNSKPNYVAFFSVRDRSLVPPTALGDFKLSVWEGPDGSRLTRHVVIVDAPMCLLSERHGHWAFEVGHRPSAWTHCKLERSYDTLEDAMSCVLEYYFGDSAHMAATQVL